MPAATASPDLRPGAHAAWPYALPRDGGRRAIAARLGRFAAPVRHEDPDGPQLELAYLVIPARDPATAGTPIVHLAGGPGDAPIDYMHDDHPDTEAIYALRDLGDVVVLDQRGDGRSRPALDALDAWDLPLDAPLDREAFLAAAIERMERLVDFWTGQGVDVGAYTTEQSADDVDLLRRLLGAERIRLEGGSYGSHLSMSVMRRHGAHVQRAILSGPEGPDHTYKLPSTLERHLDHLAALAAASPALDGRVPDLKGLMRAAHERLEREPAAVEVDGRRVVVGRFDAELVTSIAIADTSALAKLPARYLALEAGDARWLGGPALRLRTGRFFSLMSAHMDAASGASPERRARIAREAPQTLLGDAVNLPLPDVEAALGHPDLGEEFRSDLRTDVPTLITTGDLDARTPTANALELLPGFRAGHHVEVTGAGHCEECTDPAADGLRRAFLADGTPPEPVALAIHFEFERPGS